MLIALAAAARALLLIAVIVDGLVRLAGAKTPQIRVRQPGQSRVEWLMGSTMLSRSKLGLPALGVSVGPESWKRGNGGFHATAGAEAEPLGHTQLLGGCSGV